MSLGSGFVSMLVQLSLHSGNGWICQSSCPSICHMVHFWISCVAIIFPEWEHILCPRSFYTLERKVKAKLCPSGFQSWQVCSVEGMLIADIISLKDDSKCHFLYSLQVIFFTLRQRWWPDYRGLLCNGADVHTINMDHVFSWNRELGEFLQNYQSLVTSFSQVCCVGVPG